MPQADLIRATWGSSLFSKPYKEEVNPMDYFALPESATMFLIELARNIGAVNIFEFGSGSSTVALLKSGFSVVSLEYSSYWMERTLSRLSDDEKSRHTAMVRPLATRWRGVIPFTDWPIDDETAKLIRASDLILVDSPSSPPFRESTLWSALTNGNSPSVVVLDDTQIPTVARFCDRIASANPGLLHRRVRVGHCFDIFARMDDSRLGLPHSPLEVVKGWRRFVLHRSHHLGKH